jgi:hypothetical protein
VAYLLDDENEEQQPGAPGAAPLAGPAAALGGTGAAPAASNPAPRSNFVNFDRILGANQNTANNMATGVENTIAGQAKTYTNNVDAVADKFKTAVRSQVPKAPMVGVEASGGTSKYTAKPTAYTGPSDFSSYAAAQDPTLGVQKLNAQSALRSSTDHEGLQSMLQKQYGTTRAGSNLDAALTGAAGSDRFSQLRNQYKDLDSHLSWQSKHIDPLVGSAKAGIAQSNAAAVAKAADMNQQVANKAAAERAPFIDQRVAEINAKISRMDPERGGYREQADALVAERDRLIAEKNAARDPRLDTPDAKQKRARQGF